MKFFLLLTLIGCNACSLNYETHMKQKYPGYKKGIVRDGILYENEWVCGGIHVGGIDDDMYLEDMAKIRIHEIFFAQLDKQVLSSKIKLIMYQVFFQEMGIIGGDFLDMAQGNADLAQDLKELFCVSFNSGDEIAQKALDEFCYKWGLEKIEISEAHTF